MTEGPYIPLKHDKQEVDDAWPNVLHLFDIFATLDNLVVPRRDSRCYDDKGMERGGINRGHERPKRGVVLPFGNPGDK